MDNYYEVLRVRRDATQEQIKAAYKKLIKRVHPDISDNSNATEETQRINKAYDLLSNPTKRSEYDAIWEEEKVQIFSNTVTAKGKARRSLEERETQRDFVPFEATLACVFGVLPWVMLIAFIENKTLAGMFLFMCPFITLILAYSARKKIDEHDLKRKFPKFLDRAGDGRVAFSLKAGYINLAVVVLGFIAALTN